MCGITLHAPGDGTLGEGRYGKVDLDWNAKERKDGSLEFPDIFAAIIFCYLMSCSLNAIYLSSVRNPARERIGFLSAQGLDLFVTTRTKLRTTYTLNATLAISNSVKYVI